ncbi:hypothetical protein ACIQUL_09025 [Streptomyces sp. NPDC090303]|uniref:hypothetical protein n=1 Tax=Streptomyces sp. NPDC090303 TaxID=3365960 RepID=UPI00381801F1
MPDPTDPPARSGSRGGRHYPGRPALDASNAAFRRTVARLYRDRDPKTSAQAAALVLEAAAALDAVTAKANKALEESAGHKAYMARKQASLDSNLRALARRGPVRRPRNGTSGDAA